MKRLSGALQKRLSKEPRLSRAKTVELPTVTCGSA
jgi:hypothetical protein